MSSPQATSAVAAAVESLGTPFAKMTPNKAATPKTAGKKKVASPTPRAEVLEDVPVNVPSENFVGEAPTRMVENPHSPTHEVALIPEADITAPQEMDADAPAAPTTTDGTFTPLVGTTTDALEPAVSSAGTFTPCAQLAADVPAPHVQSQVDSAIASFCVSPARQADPEKPVTPIKSIVAAAGTAFGTPAVAGSPFKAPSPKSATKKTTSRTPSRSLPTMAPIDGSTYLAAPRTPVTRTPALSVHSPLPVASPRAATAIVASEVESVREAIASMSQTSQRTAPEDVPRTKADVPHAPVVEANATTGVEADAAAADIRTPTPDCDDETVVKPTCPAPAPAVASTQDDVIAV